MKKKVVLVVAVLAVASGGAGGYWLWKQPGKDGRSQTTTAVAERGLIRVAVACTGRVVANLDVDIKCKASGEVIKLPFDVSDVVKKDELLLELDTKDQQRILDQENVSLEASKARQIIAQRNLAIAEQTLATDRRRAEANVQAAAAKSRDARAKADRMKQLLDKKLASQEDCDTAETAAVQCATDLEGANVKLDELKTQEQGLELKRQEVKLAEAQVKSDEISCEVATDRWKDTTVKAPMDGVVTVRNVQIGQIISSAVSNVGGGTTVLTLSDLSHIYALASVDESEIGKVKEGQPVAITADAFRGRTFKGEVVRIAPKGVTASNVVTFEVKIEITSEQKAMLKPEMTTNAEIVAAEKPDVLTVPSDALVRKGRSYFVTLAAPGPAGQERQVEIGITDGVKTEIVSGLKEGEAVTIRKPSADKSGANSQRGSSSYRGGPPGGPGGMMFPSGPSRGRP